MEVFKPSTDYSKLILAIEISMNLIVYNLHSRMLFFNLPLE